MNTKAVVDHIVGWMSDYCDSARTKGFVVGVSGGIDSAATSALAARTGKPVICVEMPIHQPPSHVSRARKHIEYLESQFPGVSSHEVDLTPVFEQFKSQVPDRNQGEAPERSRKADLSTTLKDLPDENSPEFLALANARARLRMTTLYYFAGLHGYLVAGTGNKVEDFGVGFYTKYGDGGVDISPIADLYKSEVYAIAKEMSVIEEIMVAKPTDGLWADDRSDEDQIGASYPELEWCMEYLRKGKDPAALEGRQSEAMKIYLRLNRANQHKMVPIPVCVIPNTLKI